MNLEPFAFDALAGFDEGFADGSVSSFHDRIALRVIGRDLDMVYLVAFSQELHSSNESPPVISNDFRHRAPPAQDLLENKGRDRLSSLRDQGAPFRVTGGCAAGVDQAGISLGLREVHGVHIDTPEERERDGNRRRDKQFGGLSRLALVTCANIPVHVRIEVRPPETLKEAGPYDEKSLVPEPVVGFSNEGVTLGFRDHQLVLIVGHPVP